MPIYIKKPVPVQATKFIERDFEHWEPWVQNSYNKKEWSYRFDPETGLVNGFLINYYDKIANEPFTIEGEPGDYLVKYYDGRIDRYKGTAFEKNHEKMEVKESGMLERA